MFVRSGFPFNYDTNDAGDESGLDCSADDDGRTKQSFAEEVDINTIVKRFGLTGQLPTDVRVPLSVDYEGIFDFQSAMNVLRNAEESFMEFPAHIRERFGHSPQKLLKFLGDPDNRAEAEKLGIVLPPVVVPPLEPQLVRVVQDGPNGPVVAAKP